MKPCITLSAIALFTIPAALFGQWIEIRTVPLLTNDQSDFRPSAARGMGNLSFVYHDKLGSPFVNPATAKHLGSLTIVSSPTRSSWSDGDGMESTTGSAVNSVPVGLFVRKDDTFAGGMFAYQQNVTLQRDRFVVMPVSRAVSTGADQSTSETNSYMFGLLGTSFPEARLSVAGSAGWAEYGAIDGVELLYPGSAAIKQDGWGLDIKLGALAQPTERDRIEFIAGTGRFKMTQEVTSEPIFLPSENRFTSFIVEKNEDEMRQWLLHGEYKRVIDGRWSLAATATINWKDHPKIPNYRLANLPRDPGKSTAYNFGLGTLMENPSAMWGFEYIYEPITSHTWAEAGEPDPFREPVRTLPPYFKTVENFFDFDNHILRVGHQASTKSEWLQYRFGAQWHWYNYSLVQTNNITGQTRHMRTAWTETLLSGGLTSRFSGFTLLYNLQVILGNGRVGTATPFVASAREFTSNDLLIPASGELVVDEMAVVTHQLSIVYELE